MKHRTYVYIYSIRRFNVNDGLKKEKRLYGNEANYFAQNKNKNSDS